MLGGLAVTLFCSGVGAVPVIAVAVAAGVVFLISTAASAAVKDEDESLICHVINSLGWVALGGIAVFVAIAADQLFNVVEGASESTHWATIAGSFN